jgi:hypothetical protein
MIEFNGKYKKLSEYIEMGVSFNQHQPVQKFEEYNDFLNALAHSKIKSSMIIGYNNQETEWAKMAQENGYSSIKELANHVAELGGDSIEYDAFEGLEGLAVLSGNKTLMGACDYSKVGKFDLLIVSMFYGGQRLAQWKKYAKPYITIEKFMNELDNAHNWDVYFGCSVKITSEHSFVVQFETRGPVTLVENNKKDFYKMLENMDGIFDFAIAEDFGDSKWTISVK